VQENGWISSSHFEPEEGAALPLDVDKIQLMLFSCDFTQMIDGALAKVKESALTATITGAEGKLIGTFPEAGGEPFSRI